MTARAECGRIRTNIAFSFFVNFSPLLLPFWAGRGNFLQGGLVYANTMFTQHPYPLCRYYAGVRLRIFHEKNAARRCAARFNRLCRRGHGSGIDLELAHPRHGAVRRAWGGWRSSPPPWASGWASAFCCCWMWLVPHLHQGADTPEGPHSGFSRTTMLVLAVTLHNIPEGMAVGVVYAGYLTGSASITAMGALALSLGIAIQNFPEGAIISMPLKAEGMSRGRAFWAAYAVRRRGAGGRTVDHLGRAGWSCLPCPICSALPPGPCSMSWWRS